MTSRFAATSTTSIWSSLASLCPTIWKSTFTSEISNGMNCSASTSIFSDSSARVAVGKVIFFMITEYPEMDVQTFLALTFNDLIKFLIAVTTTSGSCTAPSIMASGGKITCPTLLSTKPAFDWSSTMALIEWEPISRPTMDLEPPRSPTAYTFRLESVIFAEYLGLVFKWIPQGQDDFSFSLHSAVFPTFDSVDSKRGYSCLAGQLRLTHQQLLPNLFQGVLRQFIPPEANLVSSI